MEDQDEAEVGRKLKWGEMIDILGRWRLKCTLERKSFVLLMRMMMMMMNDCLYNCIICGCTFVRFMQAVVCIVHPQCV